MIGIFILDRGFVVVGEAELHGKLPHFWDLSVGRTIRRWGTIEGVAQLKDGPLPETKLDAPCRRFIPFRSVIEIIQVTQKGEINWRKVLES